MSWSISLIGKPENVAKALEEHSGKLNGQSKIEFDDALPHMLAIVRQNFVKEGSGYTLPVIDLEASGSGLSVNGSQAQRDCAVSIKALWRTIV